MVVKYTDNVGEGGFNKDMESRSRLVEIVLYSRVYKSDTVLSILLGRGTTAPERKKGEERKGGTIFVVYLTLIIISLPWVWEYLF